MAGLGRRGWCAPARGAAGWKAARDAMDGGWWWWWSTPSGALRRLYRKRGEGGEERLSDDFLFFFSVCFFIIIKSNSNRLSDEAALPAGEFPAFFSVGGLEIWIKGAFLGCLTLKILARGV